MADVKQKMVFYDPQTLMQKATLPDFEKSRTTSVKLIISIQSILSEHRLYSIFGADFALVTRCRLLLS